MSVNMILLISIGAVSYFSFSNRALFAKLLFSPYKIDQSKEWYRFLTSAWVHADFNHLFLNLFVLWGFGGFVEGVFVAWYGPIGSAYYLSLFVGSTLIAHLPGYLKNTDNYAYSAVGASGGVSGVLFASIMIQPLENLCLYFVLCLPSVIFGVLYLGYSQYMNRTGNDNIGHEAHIWGALGGVILIIAFRPSVVSNFIYQVTEAVTSFIYQVTEVLPF